MMLSFFSEPKTLDEGCGEIAEFMGEDKDTICAFITKLIEEKEPSQTNLVCKESGFPVNLLIEGKDECYPRKTYTPEQFAFVKTDLARRRNFTAPNSIVLMPNNTCYTSCRYCYADILKAYGVDNFDFPDPRCKYAPPFARNLTHE